MLKADSQGETATAVLLALEPAGSGLIAARCCCSQGELSREKALGIAPASSAVHAVRFWLCFRLMVRWFGLNKYESNNQGISLGLGYSPQRTAHEYRGRGFGARGCWRRSILT
jgi:hypothetical protein